MVLDLLRCVTRGGGGGGRVVKTGEFGCYVLIEWPHSFKPDYTITELFNFFVEWKSSSFVRINFLVRLYYQKTLRIHFFINIVLFWVSLSMLNIFLIWALYYAYIVCLKMIESVGMATTWLSPERPIHMYHSTDSETDTQWCFIK